MTTLSQQNRLDLVIAIADDDTLDRDEKLRLFEAVASIPADAQLPDDLTDAGDGRNNIERVTVALDYYGLDR